MQIKASKIRYLGTREEQQDNVSVFHVPAYDGTEPFAVGILTDGVGGLESGGEASVLVNGCVSAAIKKRCSEELSSGTDILDALKDIAQQANRALKKFKEERNIEQCGTTLIVAMIENQRLHYISIGDSLIFALSGNSRLIRLNDRHLVTIEGRTGLSSAVTGLEISEIDSGSVDLAEHGYRKILLSSDGIRTISPKDLVGQLCNGNDNILRGIVETIIGAQKAKQDNLSMILFEFSEG